MPGTGRGLCYRAVTCRILGRRTFIRLKLTSGNLLIVNLQHQSSLPTVVQDQEFQLLGFYPVVNMRLSRSVYLPRILQIETLVAHP